jgi:hypothetical protein
MLGLLNSKLINWFYFKEYSNESKFTVNLSKEYLSEIPIRTNLFFEKKIVSIVDKITHITCGPKYPRNFTEEEKVLKLENKLDD